METNNKPQKTGSKARKKDATSEEIVERHLHDPRDVITTEDIQNVKVPPLDEQGEMNQILPSAAEDVNPENAKSEEKKDHKGESVPEKEIITPWDVIDL